MRSIEVEGSSIDEAIANALEVLRVDRERVAIEILTSATPGLFGFGGRKARVRATVRQSLSASLGESATMGDVQHTESPVTQGTAPAGAPAPAQHRALAVLGEVLTHLGADCTVELREGPEPGMLTLGVRGDDSGLVIGRQGQTLDALEYLLNRITGRDGIRIAVDVEGYRERREKALEAMARRAAEKVKQTGRPLAMESLSPRDRRTVHVTLQDDTAVRTRSQGEGRFRKLVILPVAGASGTSGRRR